MCVWSVRGAVCLILCEWVCVSLECACLGLWVLARLPLRLGRGLCEECVFPSLLASLDPGLGASLECVHLSGGWGPFVSRCLNPGLSAGGSGRMWIPSVCHCVSVCVPDGPINSLCLDSLAQPGWDGGYK